ncbi:kinase-like domain-containing protein [Lipomyces oligophaga]|uniref:kinase-like domain-containing protein n=1 Tax=Lipomyces oligophaga TaxID=45792 RepID=UPI0034CDC109
MATPSLNDLPTMMTSALRQLSSSISSHYSVSQSPSFQAGPWSVYDAHRRTGGQQVSVFTFDKRNLKSLLSRTSSSLRAARRDVEQVCAQLRREVHYLAKLRHPAILELVEPIEESRSTISFVCERVTTTLSSIITSRSTYSSSSNSTALDSEVDEVEIQKGLLQVAKGLEFLHQSAGIVHLGLVPGAIFVNSKSDWKLAGFGFALDFRTTDIGEYFIEQYDPRVPISMQFDIDYSAPELVIDHLVDPANDMFSLGCIIHAIYSSHSPLNTNQNPLTYKTMISQTLHISRDQGFPSYLQEILPHLLTRRPADRMSSRDFQDSKYFDNILVNTIRFLDAFPAKTSTERQAFMRGLSKVLPQFPASVQQKKILPTLLDELDKDESLVSYILYNVLQISKDLPQTRFSVTVLPALKKMKDTPTGQVVLLDSINVVRAKVTGSEFESDILPLVFSAMGSSSSSIQERALRAIPSITKSLDFSIIKNDLFPNVSKVFTHTTSLAVKVAAVTAFKGLVAGGLDKYAISEKLVPLLKGMKTREPSVIMETLDLYNLVVPCVDISVLAVDVIPHLWSMAMSPLLKLDQFRKFMTLIHQASDRVEQEHGQKLKEIDPSAKRDELDLPNTGNEEADFEALVLGRAPAAISNGRTTTQYEPRSRASSSFTPKSTIQTSSASKFAPNGEDDFDWSDDGPSIGNASATTLPLPIRPNQTPSFGSSQSGMKLQPTKTPMNLLRAGGPSSSKPIKPTPQFSWTTTAQVSNTAAPTTVPLTPQKVDPNPTTKPPVFDRVTANMTESNVWASSLPTQPVRKTSFGTVGMPTNQSSSYLQPLKPQQISSNPSLPDLNNPWQSVSSSIQSTNTPSISSTFNPTANSTTNLPNGSTNGNTDGNGLSKYTPLL